MRSDPYPILAAALVIVVIGGALAACLWHQPGDGEEGFSVTGTVTGLSPYNQPKLDVRADELFSNGMALGNTFRIETPDRAFDDAILIKNYNGMFMFDFFVNVESDGYVSVGFVGKLIAAEEGSKITLTHTGTSDRYQRTPLYNGGYTNTRADYDSDEQFANFGEVSGGDPRPRRAPARGRLRVPEAHVNRRMQDAGQERRTIDDEKVEHVQERQTQPHRGIREICRGQASLGDGLDDGVGHKLGAVHRALLLHLADG